MNNFIQRNKDAILESDDLEHLHTFKNFPTFMGCTEEPKERDVFADMSWHIGRSSGLIQLNPLLPLDVVYKDNHGSGTVGKLWQEHHREFANFINKFNVKKVLEIGGHHGILSKFAQEDKEIDWTMVEPNPSLVDGTNVRLIKSFFDDNFTSEHEFDAIIHSHVLEHIYDLNEFMNHVSHFEGPKLMLFSVPNMEAMINRGYTNCVNFEHTFLLSEVHIEFLLNKFGYSIVKKKFFKEEHSIFYCAKKTKKGQNKKIPTKTYNKFKNLFNNYITEHLSDVKRINEQIDNLEGPIFLFGAHVFTQYLIAFGLNTERIIGLLDNDPKKEKKRLYGTEFKVYNPRILKDKENPIVILRSGIYDQEIKEDIVKNINNRVRFI